jgi:hypothetical protein
MWESDSVIELLDLVPFGIYDDGIYDDGIEPDGRVLDFIELVANSFDQERVVAMAHNRTVPDDVFAKLMVLFPNECATSTRASMLNLWQLWDVADNNLIVRNENVHRDLCEIAFNSGDKTLAISVLSNPSQISSFSRRGLTSEDTEIVRAALRDSSLTMEELQPYLGGDNDLYWAAAVRHPALTSETLLEIIEDSSETLRAAVLRNPNFPTNRFSHFLNDWFEVRLAVASNPSCPESLLVDLVMRRDYEHEVVLAALLNPALTHNSLVTVLDHISLDTKLAVISQRTLEPSFLTELITNAIETFDDSRDEANLGGFPFELIEAVTRNYGLPSEAIQQLLSKIQDLESPLSSGLFTDIRINIAAHPNSTHEILLDFCRERLQGNVDYEYYLLPSEFGIALSNSNLNLQQVVGDYDTASHCASGFELRVETLRNRRIAAFKYSLSQEILHYGDMGWNRPSLSFSDLCLEIKDKVEIDFWDSFVSEEWSPLCIYKIAVLPNIRLSEMFWVNMIQGFTEYSRLALGDGFGGNPTTLLPERDARNVVNNPYAPEQVKKLFRSSL